MNEKKFSILLFLITFLAIGITAFSIYAGSSEGKKKFGKEKCVECHGDSVQYKEWENSKHAKALLTLQDEPKANSKCLQCHSSDYKYFSKSNPWGAPSTPIAVNDVENAVSCSSCHRHGTDNEHNLIMPIEKLCISCHKFDCG